MRKSLSVFRYLLGWHVVHGVLQLHHQPNGAVECQHEEKPQPKNDAVSEEPLQARGDLEAILHHTQIAIDLCGTDTSKRELQKLSSRCVTWYYRTNTNCCTSWTQLLGLYGSLVGYLVTGTILAAAQVV